MKAKKKEKPTLKTRTALLYESSDEDNDSTCVHYLWSPATCHYSSVTGEVVTDDTSKGPFTLIVIVSTALMLAVLVSLKTMEQPHSGDSILFNERDIASITTALMVTLSINEPL